MCEFRTLFNSKTKIYKDNKYSVNAGQRNYANNSPYAFDYVTRFTIVKYEPLTNILLGRTLSDTHSKQTTAISNRTHSHTHNNALGAHGLTVVYTFKYI